jgi:hypothetical protein
MSRLDAQMATRFARIALGHVTNEYPHKLDHVLGGDADLLAPRVLHPIFHGSFDWHSCVHGWWTLLTVRRLFPDIAEAQAIARLADESFAPDKVAAEQVYLDRPLSGGFERPYGWAWLLYLHLEASRDAGRRWGAALEPLARAFAERFEHYLDILTYPVRAGTHSNTAFALVLAVEWARAFDPRLESRIVARAAEWFGGDRDCQAWEPSGDDFLSPALVEALCIVATQPAAEIAPWFAGFLPRIELREPGTLFTPATVSDRSDGKIAHLDGLNLSRAWCWRSLAPLLPVGVRVIAEATADDHLQAALPHIAGDYAGEHWLASFALLALLA